MQSVYRSLFYMDSIILVKNMKRNVILFASIALLTGCNAGPQIKSDTGPTGEKVSTVRCTRETSPCFEKASEVCNGGSYRVTNSYRNAGGLFADVLPGPVTWYTMSIICGPPDGLTPEFPLRGSEPAIPTMPSVQKTQCHQIGNTVDCTTY
jgi:hypothetical protein